jgi:hypothetical protein
MKATIEVENREEADLIRAGLADAEVRALVKVMGALNQLPSKRAKLRSLLYVRDLLDEEQENIDPHRLMVR